MTVFGQIVMLVALVASGHAAFACAAGWRFDHRGLRRSGLAAALLALAALTVANFVLGRALVAKDFRFAYVAQYCSRDLAWYYALSALWVGQAGSLLVWAWMVAAVAAAYRLWPRRQSSPLREPAFAILLVHLCFLVSLMVFAADPMEPSLAAPKDGAGLGPTLQHPAMLAHPPMVFLSYALWAVPFALVLAALTTGRLDAGWVRQARPWALAAWSVLGGGILLGAEWAYEELGWGGYWTWDPVENGSLIPWLTGTAAIHAALAWQCRGALKKTAIALVVVTFGLCNFATFLTRSGIFGSLHEFSRSPIGWMFLGLFAVLAVVAGVLVIRRRRELTSDHPLSGLWTRESLIAISALGLVLLASVSLVGTLAVPLSEALLQHPITVGQAFYNNALVPIGLVLLLATAAAPLVRWGGGPSPAQKRVLCAAVVGGAVVVALSLAWGVRHPVGLAVGGLAGSTAIALVVGQVFNLPRNRGVSVPACPISIPDKRGRLSYFFRRGRQYAGALMHLGFLCLAVGVTGSSLGTQRHEATMERGETIQWAGRSIRFADVVQRQLSDRLVVEARLEVSQTGRPPVVLLPSQDLHFRQNEWASEVAIDSTWCSDFYAILHSGTGRERVNLSFLENPLVRWIWVSGGMVFFGAVLGLWPRRRPRASETTPPQSEPRAEVPRPHHRKLRRQWAAARH